MNNNFEKTIDVEYQNIEEDIYLTAPQVAQRVKTSDIKIRSWADPDVFGDLIGIKKINGRKRYKESDVYRFAFIKDLLENKKFSHEQARIYIDKHGFEYAKYDSGLVDPKDPLGFQVLASALSVEVHKELDDFKKDITNDILTQMDDRLKKYIILQGEAINNTFSNTILKVDEVISEKLDDNLSNIKNHIDIKEEKSIQAQQENKKILDEVALTMTDIKETNNRLSEILENPEILKELLKEQRKEENKKGSLWTRLKKRINNSDNISNK